MRLRKNPWCYVCGSTETYFRKDRGGGWNWYSNNDEEGNSVCSRCYMKYFISEETKRRHRPTMYEHRFMYKNRPIKVDGFVRSGVCSKCGIRPKRRTHIHHIRYHDDDPLRDTIELCGSCHMKETRRIGRISSPNHSQPICPTCGRFRKNILLQDPETVAAIPILATRRKIIDEWLGAKNE